MNEIIGIDTKRLGEALIYITKAKAMLIRELAGDGELGLPEVERSIDTHWQDYVYQALKGERQEPSNLLNRAAIMELIPGAGWDAPGFFEIFGGLNG